MTRSRVGRTVGFLAAAAIFAGLAAVAADYISRPRLIAGPMVQRVGPDGFTVVWWAGSSRPGRLSVRADGPDEIVIPARRDRDERWVARFEGPAAGSWSYRVRHASWIGRSHTVGTGQVRAAPGRDAKLRFIAFGDSGAGRPPQYELARVMEAHAPDLIIHTGDVVYPSGSWADYPLKFFDAYEPLLCRVPFYPVLGNHDVTTDSGEPLLRVFDLPDNGPAGIRPETNYWFDWGPARFVAVNSCEEPEQLARAVAPWLETALSSSDRPWKFVYLHFPPYTNGKHEPDENIRRTIVPAIEKGGADVVFCGHNHLYERTRPLRGGQIVPEGLGVCYIVTGAGGQKLYLERDDRPGYIAAYYDQDFSFTLVEVEPRSLRVRQIDRRGTVVDEWSCTKPTAGRPASAVP